jgi:plastocyanin
MRKGESKIMKKLFVLLLLCSIASFYLVACERTGSAFSSSTQAGNEVHMAAAQFVQTSITLHNGENLILVNDSSAPHNIAKGTWKNGTAQTVQELGAPKVNKVAITSDAPVIIGPFNTDGTFYLYCVIHQNMNLTVIVR